MTTAKPKNNIFTHAWIGVAFWYLTKDMDFKTLFWLFSLNQETVANFALELCCSLHTKNLTWQAFSAVMTHLRSVYYISGHSHP